MNININALISISEANQNFSKVARMVDKNGVAVILKNNVPRYIVMEFSQIQSEEIAANDDVENIARRIIAKNRFAFEELAN